MTRIMHLRIFQRESRLQIQVCGNVQNHTPKKGGDKNGIKRE